MCYNLTSTPYRRKCLLTNMSKAIILSLALTAVPIATQASTTDEATTVPVSTPILQRITSRVKSWKPKSKLVQKVLRPRQFFNHLLQNGFASYYGVGDGFQGARTASGVRFNTYSNMVAHRFLRFGTQIRIVNTSNGLSTMAVVRDRGPYAGGRILDMSYAVKMALGIRGGIGHIAIYTQ